MCAQALTPQQVGALADAVGPLYRPVVWAAALTGCHHRELSRARHEHVDRQNWRIEISHGGKLGRAQDGLTRWTTFPPSLQRMFRDAGGGLIGPLLKDPAGTGFLSARAVSEVLFVMRERSGVEARWQDLRYTWVMWLQAAELPDEFIADCAGWERRAVQKDNRPVPEGTHERAIAVLEQLIAQA